MGQKSLFMSIVLVFLHCITLRPSYSMDELPDEMYVNVFKLLNLNQRDIPVVVRVSKRWERIMNDQGIWEVYARKAGALTKGLQLKNYKAGVKYYCTPSFEDLGDAKFEGAAFIGIYGNVYRNISYDGLVCAGSVSKPNHDNTRAVRWTPEGGHEFCAGAEEQGYSRGHGMSMDGSVVVGSAEYYGPLDWFIAQGKALVGSRTPEDERHWKACKWTKGTGTEFLGFLDDWVQSEAFCTNYDGSVVVGLAKTTEKQIVLFRQIQGHDIESLGVFKGGTCHKVTGVNFDGSIVVGYYYADGVDDHPLKSFKWTFEKGIQASKAERIYTTGLNFDGLVRVGYISPARDTQEAYRAFKASKKGMEFLEPFAECHQPQPSYVTSDGLVVVGIYSDRSGWGKHWRWTPKDGMHAINALLEKRFLPVEWRLTQVDFVSPNGVIAYGQGTKRIQLYDGSYETEKRTFRAVVPRGNLF